MEPPPEIKREAAELAKRFGWFTPEYVAWVRRTGRPPTGSGQEASDG